MVEEKQIFLWRLEIFCFTLFVRGSLRSKLDSGVCDGLLKHVVPF